jgi:phosphocarrier protein HPr
MLTTPVTLINKLGLHTRAAAKLVALAARYESKIELEHESQSANCKSIMALILLGISKGVTFNLVTSGADEFEAREAIVNLIQQRFGEDE